MKSRIALLALAGPFLCIDAKALAQATANPVAGADDAFGFVVGDEEVGIYDPASVRGFDLEAAGNYRVDGHYFVKNSGVSSFFLESTTVRVGLNTFGTDLPGPSGVVDFRLRDPARGEPSLLTAGLQEYAQPYVDLLLKHRSADDRFSAAVGLGLVFDLDNGQGGDGGRSWLLGGTVRALVSPASVQAFGGEYDYVRSGLFRFTLADPEERPRLRRGAYLGQPWAVERGQRRIAGLLLDAPLAEELDAALSLVFSQEDPTRAYSHLYLDLDADRRAQGLVVASPSRRSTAWSGEARLRWTRHTDSAVHQISLVARGRRSRNSFGGDRIVDLGEVDLGQPPPIAEKPELDGAGSPLRDRIDQHGLGLAYRLSWRDWLTVNAGVLRSDYRKAFIDAEGNREGRRTAPLLYNLGAAARVASGLDLYASLSRGLEEAGTAPGSAANRNEVLSAILVHQRELGLRYALAPGLSWIVGGFETSKPYAGIDEATNVYRLLGTVRHRGLETSLSGRLGGNLAVVVGGVYLSPRLTSEVPDTPPARPAGVAELRGVASLDYAVPGIDGLALDASVEFLGRRPFRSAGGGTSQPYLPSDTVFDFGIRYRLPARWRATLRAQLLNAFNDYGLAVNSAETLEYSPPRRFRIALTSEF